MLIRKSNITNYKIPPFIVLNKDKVSFGRRGDVMLDTNQGQEISKIHAYMFMQHRLSKDTWIIEDNYSLNGTYVNKRKIHRQLLCNGDEIVFGAGSIFGYGDRVISTEKAECRYIFYSIPPKVQFYHQIDKNKSIAFKKETEVCPICLEVIEDEVLLLCGHSFCRKCIQKWETECKYCFRSCSCPVCRTEFKLNYCSDISYNNGIILVYSLEYLFRDIGITNYQEIEKCTIFRAWDEEDKYTFWKWINIVKSHNLRKLVLLKLLKNTHIDIVNATHYEILIAAQNLDISVPPNAPKNEIILLVLNFYFSTFFSKHTKIPNWEFSFF